jgi:WD40 repeat protein/serine/threonine protein kinase
VATPTGRGVAHTGRGPGAGVTGSALPARARPLSPTDPVAIGPYRLDGVLGQGGMGSVYLGRGPAGEHVAVKVVRSEYAADPGFRRLFAREARLAREVPRVCTAQVLDFGAAAGRPYLVTEFVDGPSLQAQVSEHGPLPPARLERVALAVAHALTAIHSAGTTHRDLKPANVLLSPDGPLVIDFGVAVALDGTSAHSRHLAGTPGYMAPEQARGAALTPAVDVFAWGALVAFAASGRPPFGTGNPAALLYRVVHEDPDLAGVRGPLRAIVADAMRRDPGDRPTADQLFDRLRAVLLTAAEPDPRPASAPPAPPAPSSVPVTPSTPVTPSVQTSPPGREPVGASRAGRRHRTRRRAHRRLRGWGPAGVAGAGIVAASVVAAILVPSTGGGAGPIDPRTASRQLAAAAAETTDVTLARRYAVAAYRTAPTDEAVRGVLRLFPPAGPQATLSGHSATVTGVAFSPDGQLLATASYDHTVRLWDTTTRGPAGGPLATLAAHTAGVSAVAFSPDGKLLATAGYDHAARLWDFATRGASGTPLATLTGHPATVFAVAFSPDGRLLATAGQDGAVRLWDTAVRGPTAAALATLPGDPTAVTAVAFSPRGGLFAATGQDGVLRLWDTAAVAAGRLTPAATLSGHADDVAAVAFSPDGRLLATANDDDAVHDGRVDLWDTATRGAADSPLATFTGVRNTDAVNTVAFSPDGGLLASTGNDDAVRVWDTATRGTSNAPAATLTGPAGVVVAASYDGTVRLWDTTARGPDRRPLATLDGHTAAISSFAVSSGGLLAAASQDGATAYPVRLWDIAPDRIAERACADPANRLTEQDWNRVVPRLAYQRPCG